MQRYELDAWLGDDHGLTEDQLDDLLAIADAIGERYPDVDDRTEREVAMTTAYRLLAEGDDVVDELAADLSRARLEQVRATAGLTQAALMLVPDTETEAGYARRAGVTRKTLRQWTGK